MIDNILSKLRHALQDSKVTDPKAVARTIAYDLPEDELREALADALQSMAPTIVNLTRAAAVKRVGKPSTTRWAKTAEAYESFLEQRLQVIGGWKKIGECTPDDLLFAAAQREKFANHLLDQAKWYEDLAAMLKRNRAATVSELPILALRKIAA